MMTDNTQSVAGRFARIVRLVEDSFLIVLLSTMIIFAVMQIVLRNFFDSGIEWIDPLLRLLVLWVGMAGAMVATREDHHISIDVFSRRLSAPVQRAVRVVSDFFVGLVAGIICYHSVRLVIMDKEAGSMAFADVPSWICELILPLAFGVIALRYLLYTVVHTRQMLAGEDS